MIWTLLRRRGHSLYLKSLFEGSPPALSCRMQEAITWTIVISAEYFQQRALVSADSQYCSDVQISPPKLCRVEEDWIAA